MQDQTNEQQERILSAINAKRWTQVEEIWKEILEADPKPFSFHRPIIDKLIRKQQHPEKLRGMYEAAINAMIDKDAGDKALAIVEYILSHDDKAEWLRLVAMKSARLTYYPSAGDRISELMERAGLQDETANLRRSLQKLDDMMGAAKGQVFGHRTWGLGVVRDLDPQTGKVTIDFQLKKDQTMTLDGVRGFLQRIPKDHLQARMALAPDELKKTAQEDPGEIVRVALRGTSGRIKVADLKKLLTNRFLTENEYKNFWNNARKAIKLDPLIDQLGSGVHSELILRTTPRSFFDQIFSELLTAKDPGDRYEVLRDVRRHGADAEMTEQDTEALFQLFLKPVSDKALKTDADRLNHGLLFEEFTDLFPGKENPIDMNALLKSGNHVEALRDVAIHELRRRALEHVIKIHEETWPEIFAEVTIDMDSRTVAWMEKEFVARDKEHYRQIALESILAKPGQNPDLFVWAARSILEGNWAHLGDAIPSIMVCEELLSLLSEVEESFESTNKEKAAQAKNHATKLRAVLNEGNGRYFKKAVADATVDEARRLLNMIRLHNALSPQLKAQLEGILVNEHEELRKVSRMDQEEEKKKPAHHYTTLASLDEKRSMLSKLLGTDIPGMAKVIEAARDLGDLRENSEYHAAKDRQKLLMQQASELEEQISRARVVEAKEVQPDVSHFGTRIHLRDTATGDTKYMTLMGMWETDLVNNVISYLTPVGSQLMGRRVGDRFNVVAQDGTKQEYEVLAVTNAMHSAEASE
ncbi:transcription elongation factor GreA [soil metagenome]